MRMSWPTRMVFVAVLALLVFGLNRLIHLRFESGRAYAPLSSLRTDPLGAKALHEAFESLDGIAVERNYVPLKQLSGITPDATMLVLNLRGYDLFRVTGFAEVRDFVEGGGRLVLALDPAHVAYEHLDDEEDKDTDSGPDGVSEDPGEENARGFIRRAPKDVRDLWKGLGLRHGEHEGGHARRTEAAPNSIPEEVPWREGGILVEFDDAVWKPVYSIGNEVVAASREVGEGSLVVLTDSYLFSNEALLKHRFTGFLSWAVGDQRRIIFEETHLGVSERTGVAVLMRRYGLFEFVFAFGCFMLLVVWRGSQPLLPAHDASSKTNVVQSERSVESGFCDLVSRHMRDADLPAEAFAIWKKSFIKTRSDEARYREELAQVEGLLNPDKEEGMTRRKRRPAETHSEIKSILNRKRRRHL